MNISPSQKIQNLPEYAFKAIDDIVKKLQRSDCKPIDFGVGDPDVSTPLVIRKACKKGVEEHKRTGYPSYTGSTEFRTAVAAWSKKRFGVDLCPEKQISSTIGSKESIFNFAQAFVNPGDIILVPSPGYPPYSRGAWMAGSKVYFYPLDEKNDFLPCLSAIPSDVVKAAKIMWINYPNAPTGRCPDLGFFKEMVAWTRANEIILASDEAYTEIYFGDTAPPSALEAGLDGVVIFNSLSKRSAMTGYRCGWVAGDEDIISIFRKLKTNIDSGTPDFIQKSAIAALEDTGHLELLRENYKEKKKVLIEALISIGLKETSSEGTIFLWQSVPENMTSMEFSKKLARPETSIVTIPGNILCEETDSGNPGDGYVRFALSPKINKIREAADRLKLLSF